MRASSSAPSLADPRFRANYDVRDFGAIEELVPRDIGAVLDIGCGRGGLANWLAPRGIVVDGVTWNAADVEAAATSCRVVYEHDVNNGLPALPAGSYDLVVCSHVIEHIAYPQALLRDVFRALRGGGSLLVVIPNLLFWRDRWKLLRGIWKYEEHGTFDYTHLRWYTRETMSEMLTESGFVADRFAADGWAPLPGLRFLIGERLRRKLNQALCRWRPGLFGQQLIFRVRKPANAAIP